MRRVGQPVTSWPRTRTRPAARRHEPQHVRISVVLPMPLRPMRPTASPAMHGEVDAVQHVARAVVGVQAVASSSDVSHAPSLVPEVGGLHVGLARIGLPARRWR
jgi:hypothetical protein